MKGHTRRLTRIAIACMGGTAMATGPCTAFGQAEPDASQVERIVITAEKRLTVVDTTPAAVTALSGGKLQDMGATRLADVLGLVPNVGFTTGQDEAQLFIRGIGNVFILAGGDPGVAMYADGVYVSDQTSTNVSMFDLARVEVLRGPQGALYGRNATGGAVNLVSARPTDAFKASAGVLLGDRGRAETEGFVSGPLGESGTRARLSFQVKRYDGFTDNPLAGTVSGPVIPPGPDTVGPKKLDDLDTRAVRLQTATDLGAAGSLRLIAGHTHEADAGPSLHVLPDPAMTTVLLFGVAPPADPRVYRSQDAFHRLEVNHLSGIWELPLGDNTLSVTAGHRTSRVDHGFDSDDTETLTTETRFTTSSRDDSVDLHLASPDGAALQWLVGATALRFDQRQDVRVSAMIPLGFLVPGAPLDVPLPGGADIRLGGRVQTHSQAVYVDLRYALTDRLALLAGLRYNRDRKHSDEYVDIAAFGVSGAQPLDARWTSTPGSLGTEYRLSPAALVYARYSHGFKSGAVNLGAMQPSMVRPETATGVEAGYKAEFLQRKGVFSAAVFSTRYRDMQVSQVGQATVILANASTARIDGAEFELTFKPLSALTLDAALGLMDPRYTAFTNTDLRNDPTRAVSVKGRQLAFVSRAQASVGADLAFAVGDYRAQVRADCVWRDTMYFTEFNTPDARQPAYSLFNLSASLRPGRGPWRLQAWVRNIGNTVAYTSMSIASPLLGAARQVTYTPPRQFGIGGQWEF